MSETILFIITGVVVLLLIAIVRSKEKKSLMKRISVRTEMFEKACDPLENGVMILSPENKLTYANRSMRKLLGLSEVDVAKEVSPFLKVEVKGTWLKLDELIREYYRKSEDKMYLLPRVNIQNEKRETIPANFYFDASEGVYGLKSIMIDDLRSKEQEQSQAYKHKLTNLPNQPKALIDLNHYYSSVHLDNKKLAFMIIDIDNFSRLRAIAGYEQANDILIKFAKYLTQLTKNTRMKAYHTFYNNFLLLVPKLDSEDEVVELAKKIQKELIAFYKMENLRLHLTASIGISMYPDSSSTLSLFDNAHKALAEAEKRGDGCIHVHKTEILKGDYDELSLYNGIHEAIERDEFEVYYQPIVDAKEREIVAAEALIRWKHPEFGYISPEIFVPIMEKTGFVIELGQYVLDTVLKQLKRWEMFKFRQVAISINLSLLEIEKEDFVDHVKAELEKHQIDPELIKYEITEGLAMSSEDIVNKQLWALKKLGVSIALDDFGTGYTSFSYLKKFPANLVKIDKTMVDNLLNKKEDQRIVKAMIELGHNLGMKTLVEGIENEKLHEMIVSFGADYAQGYYFSRPLPVFEFQKLLRKG